MIPTETPDNHASPRAPAVVRVQDVSREGLARFARGLGMEFVHVEPGRSIPGSFWGDSEAGLIGNRLYAREDTPLHSILHESCHWLCMDDARRAGLHTDAGGDHAEENAVCYLQILLADRIPGFGRDCCAADMDAWGYTFRLGSAGRWFREDAEDARAWLMQKGLITAEGTVQI